jgi:hypothetical protein
MLLDATHSLQILLRDLLQTWLDGSAALLDA